MKAFILGIFIALSFATIRAEEATDSKVELKTADAVPVKYYLSLPKGWTAEKTWPIVVTIDGSGHNFQANCTNFTKARRERPFIVVTPCVSSNGNDPADLQAVLKIVEEVQRDYKGQPKFFMTGFSAGGHVTWQVVFSHPELLAGAVLAAGNFRFRGVDKVSTAPEGAKLPVHSFQGDKDPYVTPLTEQWDEAVALGKKNGFQNFSRTIVPGSGHQMFADQVLTHFAALLSK